MKLHRCCILITTVALVSLMFGLGCETAGLGDLNKLLNPDCNVPGALTQTEYDELDWWDKLGYEKNSCDLYVERDLDDVLDDWF